MHRNARAPQHSHATIDHLSPAHADSACLRDDSTSTSTARARQARDELLWRTMMRAIAGKRVPFHRRTPQELAQFLERQYAGCKAPLLAEQVLQMIDEGRGELVTSRSALAFVVDHGPRVGVELRYLYVMPGQRKRGAGRALIARLRARYAHFSFFCSYRDGHWTRFARLAGFEPRLHADGLWHVTTAPGELHDEPVIGPSLRAPGRHLSDADPHGAEVRRLDQQPGRFQRFLKGICASVAVASATVSCLEV